MDALKLIAQDSLKKEVPEVKVGNTVRVIAKGGSGVSETFTVRRISYGTGIERVFPLHSPNVVKVETIRTGKVRRSKLYYLRDRVGKAAKVKEQIN